MNVTGKTTEEEIISQVLNAITNVGIILYQNEGRIVFTNNTIKKITGFEFQDLKNAHICNLIEEPYRDICFRNVNKRLNGEKFTASYKNVKLITKNGQLKTVNIYTNTILLDFKPIGIVIIIDSTEEENLRQIYTALKDINQLIIKEPEESKLFEKACSILTNIGYKAAVVAKIEDNKTIKIKYHPGKAKEFFKNVVASVDGESPSGKGTAALAFRNGEIIINPDTQTNPIMEFWRKDLLKYGFLSNCAIPLKKHNKIQYILLIFSNKKNAFKKENLELLKELKGNLEFALTKIEKDFYINLIERVLDRIDEGVIITDNDCKIEFINKAAERITGFELKELLTKTPSFVTDGINECTQKNQKIKENVVKAGKFNTETTIIRKDKTSIPVELTVVPIRKDKKLIKFVSFIKDISLRKLQEEKIAQLNNLYKTLYRINEIIISAKEETEILSQLCGVLVENLNASVSFSMVISESKIHLTHIAFKNAEFEKFISELKTTINNIELKKMKSIEPPFLRAIEKNHIKISKDIDKDKKISKIFKKIAKLYNIRSCFAIPISIDSKVVGCLVATFNKRLNVDKQVYNLLSQMKQDISAALSRIRQQKWNKIISIALNSGFSYVVILDRYFRIIYMNEEALKVHGYTREKITGKRHSIFSSKTHDKEFLLRLAKTLRKGQIFSDIFTYRTKDGRLIEGYTTIIPYKENNRIQYYIAVGKDITKEKELQEKLIFLSKYDNLTKLPKKEEFIKQANNILKQNKENTICCMAIIDINNCSYINQIYGYKTGDLIIQKTATRLTQLLKNNDITGRLEGDKFTLLIENLPSEEDAVVRLNNALNEIVKPIKLEKSTIIPTFYIGASFYPLDGKNAEELLIKAEAALMSAKRSGENEIDFFREKIQQKAVKIVKLRNKLQEAIKNKEFTLFYQPYYDVKTQQIAGAESLLRWIHDGKVIPPLEFIDVLENSNLIMDVEEQIIQEAIKTIASLKREIPISINISPKSFKRDYIVPFIKETLNEYNIRGELLTIEIVERVFLENTEYTKTIMERLRNFGIKIAVDDFGTGYSSLTYIKELPIDIIKIDMSFIRNMVSSEKDLKLVKLIIDIARQFDLKTIAEGVETQEQFNILREMGCNYIQGYLFSKPLNKETFQKLLK
ncbi:EAL domain-containing protein [Hippea maritima]|uniref:Diguanylate cyclase/phosphodiesterase with PAS/PAC sensor(S) n=1 Tax=Hippea maritima (strain ATCC 700847 / DSM 10411 / MH2) TaxID=760142 RepID=F2LV91_HIPMA|nr:EAL domain-containing protein [Hippea maritima]AEA33675.1 diguanylate cyclase/phosphodiesterase with PAS/PAC sensor(s) [Hippea maritima DSM 10411]